MINHFSTDFLHISHDGWLSRWSFEPWRPEVIAATSGCPWIAAGIQTSLDSVSSRQGCLGVRLQKNLHHSPLKTSIVLAVGVGV